MSYAIAKDGRQWRLEKDGKLVRKLRSKKDGQLLLTMIAGDLSVAPEYYRRQLKGAERVMSHANALRYAMLHAQQLGLSPTQVKADPNTGEPL